MILGFGGVGKTTFCAAATRELDEMLRPRYAAISGKSSADGLDELGAAITAKICKYGARAVSQSGAGALMVGDELLFVNGNGW